MFITFHVLLLWVFEDNWALYLVFSWERILVAVPILGILVNDIHSSVVAVTHQRRPGQWRSAEASAAIADDVVVEASVAKDAVRLLLKDIFANDHFNCFGSHESSYFTRERRIIILAAKFFPFIFYFSSVSFKILVLLLYIFLFNKYFFKADYYVYYWYSSVLKIQVLINSRNCIHLFNS